MKLHDMMPFGEFFWRFEKDIKSETIGYINKYMGGYADGDAIENIALKNENRDI